MRSKLLRARQERYRLSEKGVLAYGRARRKYNHTFKGKVSSHLNNMKDIKRCDRCGSHMIVLVRELDRRETHNECISCGWSKYAIDNCESIEV